MRDWVPSSCRARPDEDEELGYFDPRPWHQDRPQRPKVWTIPGASIWARRDAGFFPAVKRLCCHITGVMLGDGGLDAALNPLIFQRFHNERTP